MKGEGFGGVLSKSESDTGIEKKRSLSIIFPSHPDSAQDPGAGL